MSIVKVIEVIATSEKSFDDAVRNAVKEASKTVKHIKSVNVKNMNARVEGSEVTTFAVTANISFQVE